MGTRVAKVEMNWKVVIDFRMSFGSMPGRVAIISGITWVGPSG
jgi:hypothetical protein